MEIQSRKAYIMEKIITMENLHNFAYCNHKICKKPIKGIVVSFFGFGAAFRSLTLISAATIGGALGFLIYNFHPAKVFMGDTGSLFLGGAVAGMAFAINAPFAVVTVGIIYVIETASVIIQVGYFKLTHGKRLFKMAPIHHHFEKCGWSEIRIGIFASVLTAAACAVSLAFGVQ